jgi:hypothetical protein
LNAQNQPEMLNKLSWRETPETGTYVSIGKIIYFPAMMENCSNLIS